MDIVDLQSLKAWIKDTKAIREDGLPLVLYHGTGTKFETFRTPAFFTSDRWVAEGYADLRGSEIGHVKSVYLAINNPATEPEIRSAALEIGLDDEMTFALIDPLQNCGTPAKVIDILTSRGYDGAIFDEYDDSGELFTSYVPFDPRQILIIDKFNEDLINLISKSKVRSLKI